LVAELIDRQVAVIAAAGGEPSPLEAKAATATIPIVFVIGGDPIQSGLVASLNRPGGNLTGTTLMVGELGPKRLDLLRQLIPNAASVAVLVNPEFQLASADVRNLGDAAHTLGIKISVVNVRTESDIDTAFTTIVQQNADALIVEADPFLLGQRDQLVRLAARYNVPTMYFLREFVDAGGLLSYGPSIANAYRQAGVYTGRILRGAKPAELPVLQPTSFQLLINLKTAKALGLKIPPALLAVADEVIE
jgi:putative ABC transport system substrate-binding protein